MQSSIIAVQSKQADFYPANNTYGIYSVTFDGASMVSIINTTQNSNLTEVSSNGFINIQNPQSAIIKINYTYNNPYLLENVWSETKNASVSYTYAYASYINTTTRKYVTGIFKNETTPGYIDPTNVAVNDSLDLQGTNYNVTNIGSFTLSNNVTRKAIWVTSFIPGVVNIWYDQQTGIMLKLQLNLTSVTPPSNADYKLSQMASKTQYKIEELSSTNAFSMTPTSQSTTKATDSPFLSIFVGLVSILIYKKRKSKLK